MKKYSHLYLLIAVILLSAACKKDDNGKGNDPPDYYWSETTCTINGQFWGDCYPNVTLPGSKSARTIIQNLGDGFSFSARNSCSDQLRKGFSSIYIRVNMGLEVGSFVLSDFNYGGVRVTDINHYNDTIETNALNMGELIIDKFEGKRISGRFQFQAYHKQRDSVYTVANGQFEDVFVYD